ncbi:MAG TPA: SRPBCC family protein [Pararobbsia sp.]|nr:SRPBCC family protein [Pararobbsia sp.]
MTEKRSPYLWSSRSAFPSADTQAVPPRIDTRSFEREREKVFSKVWLMVGRVESITAPGDFLARSIAAAGATVVVMRDDTGRIQGFRLACDLCSEGYPAVTRAETFGRAQRAREPGDPRCGAFSIPRDGLCSCERPRFETVHTDVWQGFVFVNCARGDVPTLHDWLGGFATHFEGFAFESMTERYSYRATLHCNWKIALDALSAAYHVPTSHTASFPGAYASGVDDVKLIGDHRCAGVYLRHLEPRLPIAKIAAERASRANTFAPRITALPERVNPSRRDDFSFELGVCFPNLLLQIAEHAWLSHQFWPLAPNRTLWEGRYYVAPARTHSERWTIEQAQCLQRNAWLEDITGVEDTHEAIAAGTQALPLLHDEHPLIRHGYNVLERYMSR